MPARRTSNREKRLRGTDRPHRMRDEPDVPLAEDFTPPDDLLGPDAVEAWNEITDTLGDAKVLATGDLMALVHLCNLHARCLALWRDGDAPTAAELTQLRLMMSEFGLTPASRSKATPMETKKDDSTDRMKLVK